MSELLDNSKIREVINKALKLENYIVVLDIVEDINQKDLKKP